MSMLQTKAKPKSKRSNSSGHNVGSGSPAAHRAAPTAEASLGAFYGAGPALSLGAPVQAKFTVGHANDQATTPSISSIPSSGFGAMVQTQVEEERDSEDAPLQPMLIQHQAVEEEPDQEMAVQQAAEEAPDQGTADQPAGEEEPVQLWDCDEYTKPTCVQTKCEACAAEFPVQTKCAACEAELPVQTKCAACATEEQVQTKCAACEAEEQVQNARAQTRNPHMIQREARRGLKDATLPLPHGEQIQAAFGRHDVSQVRTSVGGSARTANRRMGALAFTSGDRIGFRDSPSLRLAAHEATHVVQQREGLSLPDNVGRAGDRWERHADRVADEVVSGRSAEPLLNEVATPDTPSSEGVEGGGDDALAAPAPAVQPQITSSASRLFEPAPTPAEAPEPAPEGEGETPEATPEETEPSDSSEGSEEEGSALEVAEEGDSEAPPEGITADGGAAAGTPASAASVPTTTTAGAPTSATGTPTSTAGDATGASTDSTSATSTPAPAAGVAPPAPDTPAEAAPGGGISGRCYRVNSPPPPDNTPDPHLG